MLVIRFFALDGKAVRAKKAAAARYGKRNDDSITTSEISYFRAHLLDNPHELVPHY
jgi:hypothetical protein